MTNIKTPRLIAYYLPQYHPIPENDEWWGKGFTEWTNVAKAKPLFKGHYQPHVPADLGFYDLRVPETRQAQADMAKQYGIEGFCYWHYWFAGRRILERPFNEVLESGEPDFPFCLGWANATWTGIWYDAPDHILIEQTYPGVDDHTDHFQFLLSAFQDHRYIRVDDKPIFFVLQPSDLNDGILELWKNMAMQAGLKGLFFVGVVKNAEEAAHVRALGFDACTISRTAGKVNRSNQFSNYLLRIFGEKRIADVFQRVFKRPFNTYDFRDASPFIPLEEDVGIPFFPTVMPGWDNTPRSGLNGHVFTNSAPKIFQNHLEQAIKKVQPHDKQQQIIVIKSWNEWAEGNHLEPDIKYGHGYLQAIRNVLNSYGNKSDFRVRISDDE